MKARSGLHRQIYNAFHVGNATMNLAIKILFNSMFAIGPIVSLTANQYNYTSRSFIENVNRNKCPLLINTTKLVSNIKYEFHSFIRQLID